MNLKVMKRYVDRFTREIVEAGTILKNVPEERACELISAGVAEEIKTEKPEKPKKQKPESRPDEEPTE